MARDIKKFIDFGIVVLMLLTLVIVWEITGGIYWLLTIPFGLALLVVTFIYLRSNNIFSWKAFYQPLSMFLIWIMAMFMMVFLW